MTVPGISRIIRDRDICEVLHFTTNKGLTGILATGFLKSNQRVSADEYLENILQLNCPTRKDQEWLDYVNLSITRINGRLFSISSGNWHLSSDLWWCALAFDPSILTHEGVYFTTTNNMYSGVKRRPGPVGLESMFAPTIEQWSGRVIKRSSGLPANQPTCPQAEVLYPGQISTTYLRHIYVTCEEDEHQVAAQCGAFRVRVPCSVNPSRFTPENLNE